MKVSKLLTIKQLYIKTLMKFLSIQFGMSDIICCICSKQTIETAFYWSLFEGRVNNIYDIYNVYNINNIWSTKLYWRK